jgi:hypothetical protein
VDHQSIASRTRALDSALGRTCFALGLVTSLLAAGCGGPPKQANSEDEFGKSSDTPSSSPPSSGGDSSDAKPASGGDSAPAGGDSSGGRLNKDQEGMIAIALRRGRDKAVQCADVVPNSPSGDANVKVTFDGKKASSVDASVDAPFAGTPIEACIKRAFIGEIVVPFDGGNIDRSTTVKIATKSAPADPKKPPKK